MKEDDINYKSALYRRNSNGEPYVWQCNIFDYQTIVVKHGVVGKKISTDFYKTNRNVNDEVKSRRNAKIKSGYKAITAIKDSNSLPVEGSIQQLRSWLATYLPCDRDTADGILLPMLAKVYDRKVFDRCPSYIGQYKINGLRCFAKPYVKQGDLFHPYGIQFQSREGTIWNSLTNLEEYLLSVIPNDVLDKMIADEMVLDGEIYLPGHTINEINHFVKDPNCTENKLLQYWVYDIAVDETPQWKRTKFINDYFHRFQRIFETKSYHLNNTNRLIALPNIDVSNDSMALIARNQFIELGFEGLILRNPDECYDYGKRRVGVMVKYKKTDDGIFEVIDIKPEGVKRADIPLLVCKNDINDELFEVHLSASLKEQREVLINKEKYLHKKIYISYGERSGINQVPFHVREVRFI